MDGCVDWWLNRLIEDGGQMDGDKWMDGLTMDRWMDTLWMNDGLMVGWIRVWIDEGEVMDKGWMDEGPVMTGESVDEGWVDGQMEG